MNHTMRKRMKSVVIILFWLAVWQIAAVCIDNHILLVGPGQVLYAFAYNMIQPDFMKIVIHSFVRIGLGFFLALFAGLVLGAVSYHFTIMEEILAPAVQAVKSIPVASFVVILLVWFGSPAEDFFFYQLSDCVSQRLCEHDRGNEKRRCQTAADGAGIRRRKGKAFLLFI